MVKKSEQALYKMLKGESTGMGDYISIIHYFFPKYLAWGT
mgnify:CR=1 FL=1